MKIVIYYSFLKKHLDVSLTKVNRADALERCSNLGPSRTEDAIVISPDTLLIA